MLTPSERTKRSQAKRWERIQQMKPIECGCGCGTLVPPLTVNGKPRRYAHGHNQAPVVKGRTPWNKGRKVDAASHWSKGPNADEIRDRIAAKARAQHERQRAEGHVPKSGWSHSQETRERMTEAVRRRDLSGENNPFYGRSHSPEARARMGFRHGDEHPLWKGGVGTMPYGPGFTKRLRRLIRDRDGHRCQRCGTTRADVGRTLEVHHIDHDRAHNAPENLITTCHPCNVWLTWHPDERFERLDPPLL